jgi:hypothetical protein
LRIRVNAAVGHHRRLTAKFAAFAREEEELDAVQQNEIVRGAEAAVEKAEGTNRKSEWRVRNGRTQERHIRPPGGSVRQAPFL